MKKTIAAFLTLSLCVFPVPTKAQSTICGPGPFVDFTKETLTVSTTAVGLSLSVYAPSANPPRATRAIVTVNANDVRYWGAATPTDTDGTILQAGQSIEVCALNLGTIRFIRDGASDVELAVNYSRPPS